MSGVLICVPLLQSNATNEWWAPAYTSNRYVRGDLSTHSHTHTHAHTLNIRDCDDFGCFSLWCFRAAVSFWPWSPFNLHIHKFRTHAHAQRENPQEKRSDEHVTIVLLQSAEEWGWFPGRWAIWHVIIYSLIKLKDWILFSGSLTIFRVFFHLPAVGRLIFSLLLWKLLLMIDAQGLYTD